VFKLFWIQAIGHLNNLKMEVEMLRSAPPKPSSSQQESARKIDDSWKLDMPLNGSPLLDKSGRVRVAILTSFNSQLNRVVDTIPASLFGPLQFFLLERASVRDYRQKYLDRIIGYLL
jgi:hypothetical protein